MLRLAVVAEINYVTSCKVCGNTLKAYDNLRERIAKHIKQALEIVCAILKVFKWCIEDGSIKLLAVHKRCY